MSDPRLLLLLPLAIFTGAACAEDYRDPRDPLESWNRAVFRFNEHLDEAIVRPVARGYVEVVPGFARTGVRNFFSNLDDVAVIANGALQLKLEQTSRDFMRLAINTSLGMFGLFDIAGEIGLKKNNEDFGQTLGYWGVGAGPYLVLPFLGASSLRDFTGFVVDSRHADPVRGHDDVSARNPALVLRAVGQRADLLGAGQVLDAAALDPYEFTRDLYLERRRGLVHDGNPPPEEE
jgi:phospholipid-binding lipoprotein MlaA